MVAAVNAPIFPSGLASAAVVVADSDTTAKKTLYTDAGNGSIIRGGIGAVSIDTVPRDFCLWMNIGGTDYLKGTITVAAGAGNTGAVVGANMFSRANIPDLSLDTNGNMYLKVPPSGIVKISAAATLSSTKNCTFVAADIDTF